MSPDLSDLYRSLADEAGTRTLPAPEKLRRTADRRARIRMAGTALAVAVLVTGAAAGSQLVLSADPAPVAPPGGPPTSPSVPSPTPSAIPSGSPSTATGTPYRPTSIPDEAFFQLAPENDKGISTFVDAEVLPPLCGARLASDDAVVQRRSRHLAYKKASSPANAGYIPDGSYVNSITIYEPGRADDAMGELRDAVRACPTQRGAGGSNPATYHPKLLDGGDFGDESVLFEIRSDARDLAGNPVDGEQVRLIRAIRVGDVVTLLWEQGWEGTSAERAQVDADSHRAVRAIMSWLG
ncbi:hypothetical protein QTQ03_13935 [Micromonospora sp. WMMA1363]|uniref:hypothetical protein n=1 Tax=Micromonospora sp. WMMA1363 TaxID=3053985 RepID=UPI00259CF057|nr:hypothetical protein [Micromonospora sp. WMMA1363]MDM4720628.1 hypothetical protein [Micromonospora sp. WMMA1363]